MILFGYKVTSTTNIVTNVTGCVACFIIEWNVEFQLEASENKDFFFFFGSPSSQIFNSICGSQGKNPWALGSLGSFLSFTCNDLSMILQCLHVHIAQDHIYTVLN